MQDILKLTPDNYVVPAGEEGFYHVRQEIKSFNGQTGERQSVPRIQIYEPKIFKSIVSSLKQQGYTLDILHNPDDLTKKAAPAKGKTAAQLKKEAAAESKKEDNLL